MENINIELQYQDMKCIKCDIELNDENYTYKSSKKQGKKICDSCLRERSKRYYAKNHEKILEKFRTYYVMNLKNDEQYNAKNRKKCKQNYIKNREKYKDRALKRIYGITLDDLKKMLELQEYRCKICGAELELASGRKNKKTPFVDHDHKTGRIRGVLCYSCNLVLGSAHDDPGILENAIEYLRNELIWSEI